MKKESKSDLAFRQGYYCATANIIATHGETVIAEDVLKAYGRVNFSGIDAYDVKKLKPIADEIARKRNL